MATAPTDQAGCLALARRVVGGGADWTPEDWDAQLADDALERGGVTYFRPYRTAIAYLLNPERLKQRTEGQVTEQFVDTGTTHTYLRQQDEEWAAGIPAPPDADGDGTPDGEYDSSIKWGGW